MENKEQLIRHITALFFKNGIKSMTMDDISAALGISKKTLYKHFSDKNSMVAECIGSYLEEDRIGVEKIFSAGYNAIEELFEVMRFTVEKIRDFHPSIHYDLQKYHPEAWRLFNQYKSHNLTDCVALNLKKGIKENLYRENINVQLVSKIHIAKIDMIFDTQIFPPADFTIAEVATELVFYHLYAIVNDMGRKYITEKLNAGI
jgi:AcrR family transcriptional regulator